MDKLIKVENIESGNGNNFFYKFRCINTSINRELQFFNEKFRNRKHEN